MSSSDNNELEKLMKEHEQFLKEKGLDLTKYDKASSQPSNSNGIPTFLQNDEAVMKKFPTENSNSNITPLKSEEDPFIKSQSQKRKPPPVSLTDPQMDIIIESCMFKTAAAAVMGMLFGFGIGALFSMGGSPLENEGKSTGRLVIEGFKQSGRNGLQMGKGFATAGTLFAGSECTIEHFRGKTDMWNTVAAGCFSGAALGYKGGVQSMAVGCVGFAGFSIAIDHFTERHDPQLAAKHDDIHKF